ncbi:TPA: 3-phosphoshikimate 1-carboxyvinyltransferase [Candidatus Poribacteria bacterium]|nr:3-phosphoshikimate 1-carboxyvinyltransferase [Candidatus Poribacteria bacterium]
MRQITVNPAESIKGQINVPGDKSISHRAVMIGSLSEGVTRIQNFLMGEDCLNTLRAFRAMGIQTEIGDDRVVTIHGNGLDGLCEPEDVIDIGNSGTSIRIMSGVLAGQPFYSVITGDSSIRRRPMGRITEPLRKMGARIFGRGNGTLAPLTIIGGDLKSIYYKTPVASAQVKSSILMAGLFANGYTTVTEPAQSRDHTERMLRFFGAEVQSDGLNHQLKGLPRLKGREIIVPGDISSAAYFLVAAAITPGSEILVKDVGINPTRAGILEALKQMGAKIQVENHRKVNGEPIADIRIYHSKLRGATFKGDVIVRMIDEIPLLAVAATQAEGETVIRDAKELRVKETDRIAAMTKELRQMGAEVEPIEDGMIISGNPPPTLFQRGVQKGGLRGAECDSHGDHRIAMSVAVAALIADGETTISDIDCVQTSFPSFFKLLDSVRR